MRGLRALGFLLMLAAPVAAQEPLTLSQALDRAVRHNHALRIARNDSAAAASANSFGNAGMLPTIEASAGVTTTRTDLDQTDASGSLTSRVDVESRATTAGVRATWTLFDGGRMFLAKGRLDAEQAVANHRLRSALEGTIASTIAAYFDVVRLQQSVRVLEGAIAIREERVRIARARFESGAASKLDLLQSQVDRDTRISDRARTQVALDAAIARVNDLMGEGGFRAFTASDTVTLGYEPDLQAALAQVMERNSEVRIARSNREASDRRVWELRAGALPRLVGGAAYTNGLVDNAASSFPRTETAAVSGSLALTWNLFDGWSNATQVTRARLQASSARELLGQVEARLAQQLAVARRRYAADRDIVRMERDMVEVARENAEVALEAYRNGGISGVQLNEAQNSYQQALERFIASAYSAKLSETELMRLNGDLVK